MTPTKSASPTWDNVAKASLAFVGVILTTVVAWAGKAADRQATALEDLKTVVYQGQKESAVLSTRMVTVERAIEESKAKITAIESRLNKDYRP